MRVRVEFDVKVPDVGATHEEIEDWLRFETNDSCWMPAGNSLDRQRMEPVPGSLYVTFFD